LKDKFELGDTLKDVVTGYKGIAMVRAEYFTGCVHYGLCPKNLKDGKIDEWEWIDQTRLVLVKNVKRVVLSETVNPSGPRCNGPQL